MDGWCDRPTDYADIRRALHLMLVALFGMKPADAVSFNPHGFRHVLVSLGQHFMPFGVISEPDLELLGHWSK